MKSWDDDRICEGLADELADLEGASPLVMAHLATCGSCRTEVDRYRAIVSELRSMADAFVQPPDGLVDEILVRVGRVRRTRAVVSAVSNHRGAYLGGLVGAAATTVSVVLAARSRRRVALA